MEKRKGVSVLLFVQQKIFGMYCTFLIALHCHSLRSRKCAGQQPGLREKVAYLNPRTGWKQNGRWKHLSNSQQLVDVSFSMLTHQAACVKLYGREEGEK